VLNAINGGVVVGSREGPVTVRREQ
jgi:hypothetical protein